MMKPQGVYMRVYVMKLSHGEEVILQSGVAAYPDASQLGVQPYHCEIIFNTHVMPYDDAVAKEAEFRETFKDFACTPAQLESSSWNFYTCSDPLLDDMSKKLLGKAGMPDELVEEV
jgi:hypothetical protein